MDQLSLCLGDCLSRVFHPRSQGELIQKLLCRWWYALEWPAKEDLRPAPPSYEALEGYPGVFICVEVRDGGLTCVSTAKLLHLVSLHCPLGCNPRHRGSVYFFTCDRHELLVVCCLSVAFDVGLAGR